MTQDQDARREVPIPRNPGVAIVIAANAQYSDPALRDSLRQMINERYPLLQMVEAMGLDDDLTDPIRKILGEVTPEVADGIRNAVLKMLDDSEAGDYALPLDCTVTTEELNEGIAVEVEVLPEQGVETIHVRPLPA